jgi:hypothetical protein
MMLNLGDIVELSKSKAITNHYKGIAHGVVKRIERDGMSEKMLFNLFRPIMTGILMHHRGIVELDWKNLCSLYLTEPSQNHWDTDFDELMDSLDRAHDYSKLPEKPQSYEAAEHYLQQIREMNI